MPALTNNTRVLRGTREYSAMHQGEVHWPFVWTPDRLAGLSVWWDAADLASITTQWPDKSGTNRHGNVVGTPAPILMPSALNGRQVVRFTISQGRLRLSETGITKDFTLIVVNRKWVASGGNGRCISTDYPFGTNCYYGYHVNPPPTGNMHSFSDGGFSPSTAVAATTDWVMYSVDGASVPSYQPRVFINGIYRSQAASGGKGLGGHLYISGYHAANASESMSCEVAEVLLYNRKLPDADRQKAEGYLQEKWGLS